MTFEKKPSFERAWRKLERKRQDKAREALEKLVRFLEGGPRPAGLGLKKLKEDFWEIRTDLRDRILFRLSRAVVQFVIIGDHDEIRRILR